MTFVNVHVQGDTRAYDAARLYLRAVPGMIQQVVETRVRPAVQQVVERELIPYPPPIAPGVFKALATPKQFRAVMAKIKRGEWTGRTGGLGKRWRVIAIRLPNGAAVETANTSPIGKYVIGRFQQPFHTVTGWPKMQYHMPVIARASIRAFQSGFREVNRQQWRKR